ncbi:hypothetical protein [Engelhardtia mirabilis]|uniref:Cortical protein marker for cell polarity n=1 Tax=Engelhardtia mirabilis TaxID=2528011 RepID=A0A518BFH3_9BACT|nr:hypothetical protein Pla133_07940 [Planctomycetes bacterium Pla133]QDV00054.1 hypothetical protein Pla86_07930 [Planctomycetes bacterium Pla86]
MQRLRQLAPGLAAGLALLAWAAPAPAQWSPAAYNPAAPILTGGFQVVHDDGGDLLAFSAFAQGWNKIGPSGSTILGVGDWTTLFRTPSGQVLGYSARLDRTMPAPAAGPLVLVAVEDDVALVIEQTAAGLVAHGYSAQTGTWASTPLAVAAVGAGNVATSRFVLGIRDAGNLLGFAARRGAWVAQPVANSAPPSADGNVLAADVSAAGAPRVAAFSGALGAWTLSPPRHAASVTTLDHNVLHFTTPGPGVANVRDVGYSAYTGAFVTNPVVRLAMAPVTLSTGDNLLYVEEGAAVNGQQAFGARPGLWATAAPAFGLLGMGEDSLVLHDGGGQLRGFSGLSQGVFVPQVLAVAGPVYMGPADHLSAVLDGSDLRMFSPAQSAWAPPAPVATTASIVIDDAVAAIVDSSALGVQLGYATRHNTWVSAATGPIVSTNSAGSVIALQDAGGGVWLFEEGCNRFDGPHLAGAGASVSSSRNLTVLNGGSLSCFSVQRESVDPVPAAVPLPPAVGPLQDENVACFVDAGAAELWAFGSTAPIHARNQWPRGTEFQTFGPAPVFAADFFVSMRTPAAVQNWLLWSLLHACPGFAALPAPSPLACVGAPTFVGPLGATPASGSVELGFNLVGGPANLQVWLQGLQLDPAGTPLLTAGCAPAWIF